MDNGGGQPRHHHLVEDSKHLLDEIKIGLRASLAAERPKLCARLENAQDSQRMKRDGRPEGIDAHALECRHFSSVFYESPVPVTYQGFTCHRWPLLLTSSCDDPRTVSLSLMRVARSDPHCIQDDVLYHQRGLPVFMNSRCQRHGLRASYE